MNPLTLALPQMDDPPAAESRQLYEALLGRAMAYAERLVPRAQALEISHDVAVEILRRFDGEATPALLYVAVTNRARTLWRGAQRRAVTEAAYLEVQSSTVPAWAEPGADLELHELRDQLESVIAAMPAGMRDAFLLVRDEGVSYKEAATRLGVGIGTVHTQVSRANALLRECVRRYRAGDAQLSPSLRRSPPMRRP
jgi:RNA polymerase sigma-70 factor (ECF subfamily)